MTAPPLDTSFRCGLAAPTRRQTVPSIDVIVPCYNYDRFLRSCIDSVLGQVACEVRILIIDDASTDDSVAIARSLAAQDNRIQVLTHEKNRGHIATYNEGIELLSADYMLLLSSDDMLAPGALARAIALMEADQTIGFVYGTSLRFNVEADIKAAASRQITRTETAAPTVEEGITFVRRFCEIPVNTIETATAVVRTSLQKRVGGYRPELPHSGDMEMWLRLAAHAKVGFLPTVQAYTRIHAKNMRHGYKANRDLEDFRQRRIVFQTFFAEDGHDLSERPALEALAYRSLAVELLWAAANAFDEGAPNSLVVQLTGIARDICPAITKTALWWKVVTRRLVGSALVFRTARRLLSAPSRQLRGQLGRS
jgi:glycosyltransferase involved in cell wall biosynthesis